jgi:8-oxo-dGTP diphosphatase
VTCSSKHSVSVAGIVVDAAGRALLVRRRDNGHWEPPGGVLELDESIPDGLRREVREETGLEVEPERLTGVYKNMTRGIVALVFRCHITGGTLSTGPESAEFRWVTPAEIPAVTEEAYGVRVLDALVDPPAAPAVREHDGRNLI